MSVKKIFSNALLAIVVIFPVSLMLINDPGSLFQNGKLIIGLVLAGLSLGGISVLWSALYPESYLNFFDISKDKASPSKNALIKLLIVYTVVIFCLSWLLMFDVL